MQPFGYLHALHRSLNKTDIEPKKTHCGRGFEEGGGRRKCTFIPDESRPIRICGPTFAIEHHAVGIFYTFSVLAFSELPYLLIVIDIAYMECLLQRVRLFASHALTSMHNTKCYLL